MEYNSTDLVKMFLGIVDVDFYEIFVTFVYFKEFHRKSRDFMFVSYVYMR